MWWVLIIRVRWRSMSYREIILKVLVVNMVLIRIKWIRVLLVLSIKVKWRSMSFRKIM